MASLVGQQLKNTYDSLLKTSDNDALGGTYKEITDGSGNGSNLYLGTGGRVGIGASSPSALLDVNGDAKINGLTVGRGLGNETNNTAVGNGSLSSNTSGEYNTGLGRNSLSSNTEGVNNTAVGLNALQDNSTGNNNTAVGLNALLNVTTGSKNIGIGLGAGDAITTGSNNVIIGDIAGSSSLSDTVIIGAGSAERMRIDSSGYLRLAGAGIQFNGDTATANALDDYEEGTWTATVGGSSNLTSVTEVQNKYTKIGNVVHLNISWTASVSSSTAETQIVFALPFATSDSHNDVGVVSVISGSGADRFGVGATFRGTTSTTNVYVIIGGNQINATGSSTIKTSFTYIIE